MRYYIFMMYAIISMISVPFAFAEVIILKSGGRVEGKIVEKTDQFITLEDESGSIHLYLVDEINQVEESAAPTDGSKISRYVYEAKTYFKQKKYEDALFSMNKLMELDPNNEDFLLNLAAIYYYLGRFSDASQSLQEASRIDPQNAGTYYMGLGIINDLIGEKEKAKSLLFEASDRCIDESNFFGFLSAEYVLKKMNE